MKIDPLRLTDYKECSNLNCDANNKTHLILDWGNELRHNLTALRLRVCMDCYNLLDTLTGS